MTHQPEDPRIALGFEVLSEITGPFFLVEPARTSPQEGGTLDIGLGAHLPDGRPVVLGELWARCPCGDDGVRLDIRAVAKRLIDVLNHENP